MRKQKQKEREGSGFTIDEATGRKALEQFKTGKPLFGKDGAFGPMLQAFLEAALEGELSAHLSEEGAAEEMEATLRPAVPTVAMVIAAKTLKQEKAAFPLPHPETGAALLNLRL